MRENFESLISPTEKLKACQVIRFSLPLVNFVKIYIRDDLQMAGGDYLFFDRFVFFVGLYLFYAN
jgi:hypothetical protein